MSEALRLFLVEDNDDIALLIRKSLERAGHHVTGCRTAADALIVLGHSNYNLVLLDHKLPDMSGLDAFHEIREIDPRLPVIIITAFATTETAIEAMKRGAFEYLLKPVDFRQLRELVTKAVELSRVRHVPALFSEEEFPDDIAVVTHEKTLTQTEIDYGAAYWKALWAASSDEHKKTAWRMMTYKFGSNRSAWVALQTKPVNWRAAGLASADDLQAPVFDLTKPANWTEAPHTRIMPDRFVLMGYRDNDSGATDHVGALMQGLTAFGWKAGANLQVDWRWAGGDPALFERHAAELVALRPAALLAQGTPSVNAA